jgi:hypothetical protein
MTSFRTVTMIAVLIVVAVAIGVWFSGYGDCCDLNK